MTYVVRITMAAALLFGGLTVLTVYGGWLIAFGVMLVVWSHNLEYHVARDRYRPCKAGDAVAGVIKIT